MPDMIQNATWSEIRKALLDPTLQIGLFGPPGVGKTTALMTMAAAQAVADNAVVGEPKGKGKGKTATVELPVPPRYIGKVQFHSEIAPAEVMGMYVPDGDKFRWEAGPGDLAYAQGGLLVLDEIDQASGPMKSYLMGLLDRGPGGTISYVGRTFKQAPGYQAVATMNEKPDSGVLPEALLDRFDAWFLVASPSEEQLALLEPDLRELCEDSYHPESVTDPVKGPVVTFRMIYSLQKLRKIMPLEKAVLGACKNNTMLARSILDDAIFRKG
jgi:MoxR-like ATPase